jgi:hypothetical protein
MVHEGPPIMVYRVLRQRHLRHKGLNPGDVRSFSLKPSLYISGVIFQHLQWSNANTQCNRKTKSFIPRFGHCFALPFNEWDIYSAICKYFIIVRESYSDETTCCTNVSQFYGARDRGFDKQEIYCVTVQSSGHTNKGTSDMLGNERFSYTVNWYYRVYTRCTIVGPTTMVHRTPCINFTRPVETTIGWI